MSANYILINVCFFYFTQYAVIHVVCVSGSPSGYWYCLNHGSIILGSQVDFWTLEDSVSSVRIHSAVFTHSMMLKLLYQKVLFIHYIRNPKSSCYKDQV